MHGKTTLVHISAVAEGEERERHAGSGATESTLGVDDSFGAKFLRGDVQEVPLEFYLYFVS